MRKLIVIISIFALSALGGCVYVHEQNIVVSHRGNVNAINTADCSIDPPMMSTSEQVPALNSNGFTLLSWNIQKGKREGWEEDFRRLSVNKDLLIIQEAYLDDTMVELLDNSHLHWNLALAFEYGDIKAGVLTASKFEPSFLCTFRNTEPLIRIPKTILITRYPLSVRESVPSGGQCSFNQLYPDDFSLPGPIKTTGKNTFKTPRTTHSFR